MDIAWKEDPRIGKQRSWRVVISDGVMRIGGSSYDRKSGRWVGEVDVAIRPEDVLSVKFLSGDDAVFPIGYTLEMKYRSPRDGNKAKVKWLLQYPDAETLGALLGGLEGFVESSAQRNVSGRQMRVLRNFTSQAEESARKAADERRKDEDFEARQDDVSNMVGRDRLDELGCDEQKLSALLPGTSFNVGIVVGVIVLGICIPFILCGPVLHTTLNVFLVASILLTLLFARVAGWLVERSKKFTWRIKGQRVILNADGVMLLANDREGEEVRCWYTEGCGDPLRITRIDGYEVERKRIVLRGSFSAGRIDPAGRRSFVPAGDETRAYELEIYRIYADEDERRLLDELDTLVAHNSDQSW